VTREQAGTVVVRVTVGFRTGRLEQRRIVLRPRAALTGGQGVVGTSAAVFVRVELGACALARHDHAAGHPDGQLARAITIQVGHTAGRFAVVLVVTRVREPPGRHHPDRQVVAVHQ